MLDYKNCEIYVFGCGIVVLLRREVHFGFPRVTKLQVNELGNLGRSKSCPGAELFV